MTYKFDRITTHSAEPFALPTIRDTGISVSDVVRPIVSGEKSVQEVLDAHPSLELEDVHQALAFAVGQLTQTISAFASESKSYLGSILGYSQVLGSDFYQEYLRNENVLKTDTPTLDEISQIIHRNSASTIHYWDTLRDWASLNYSISSTYFSSPHQQKESLPLEDFLDKVRLKIKRFNPNLSLKINTDTRSARILVISTSIFVDAIAGLCDIRSLANNEYCRISANSAPNKSIIQFMIRYPERRVYGLELPVQNALTKLKRMNINVKIEINDNTITFTFDLPIANAE